MPPAAWHGVSVQIKSLFPPNGLITLVPQAFFNEIAKNRGWLAGIEQAAGHGAGGSAGRPGRGPAAGSSPHRAGRTTGRSAHSRPTSRAAGRKLTSLRAVAMIPGQLNTLIDIVLGGGLTDGIEMRIGIKYGALGRTGLQNKEKSQQ